MKHISKWTIVGIAVAIFGLVVLVLAVAGDEQEQVAAGPAPTVTKTVEVPGPTVTETIEVDSGVCVEALDAADLVIETAGDGLGLATEALGVAGDGFTAIGEFDMVAMEVAISDITSITGQIDNLTPVMQQRMTDYERLSAECRSS